MKLAKKSAVDVAEFLQEMSNRGQNFEVYEYGDDKPAYNSRTSGCLFSDYLEDFCARLPNEEVYLEQIYEQIYIAKHLNNVEATMDLLDLRKQIVKPYVLEEVNVSDLALEMIEKSANSVEILERDIEEVTNVQKGKFVPKKIGETSSKKVKPVRGKRYGR